MGTFPLRAVAAAALPSEREALQELLFQAGCGEVACVGDGPSALEQIRLKPTDLLVAEAVLPGLDGAALADRIGRLALTVRPAVVILTVPGIHPRAQDCAILQKPLTGEVLFQAMEDLRPERRPIPEQKRLLAERTLDAVGVPHHPGREYLLKAIGIVWLDARWLRGLTTRLYPAIAEAFGVNARQVERAMRHAIDAAWRGGELDAQYKLFGDTLDAKRGGPTCGEMIAQIADILRWEGKA